MPWVISQIFSNPRFALSLALPHLGLNLPWLDTIRLLTKQLQCSLDRLSLVAVFTRCILPSMCYPPSLASWRVLLEKAWHASECVNAASSRFANRSHSSQLRCYWAYWIRRAFQMSGLPRDINTGQGADPANWAAFSGPNLCSGIMPKCPTNCMPTMPSARMWLPWKR